MKIQKREDWDDWNQAWQDDPQQAANHMAFGMSLEQRKRARMQSGKKSVPTWV
jgi:hypothetical protein